MSKQQQTADQSPTPEPAQPAVGVSDFEPTTPPATVRLRAGAGSVGITVSTLALRRVLETARQHGWEPQGVWRLTNYILTANGQRQHRYSRSGGLLPDELAGQLTDLEQYCRSRRRITREDGWALLATLEPLVQLGAPLDGDMTARQLVALIQSAPGAAIDISAGGPGGLA